MNCTKEGNETSIYHCIRRALSALPPAFRSHAAAHASYWCQAQSVCCQVYGDQSSHLPGQ